jgi:glycerophosphoryl diester phosphodiesterase
MKHFMQPVIFAHRGASNYAPENTIAAFELAVTQGAEAIELDAKLCADGHVIVIHDQSLDRTTNGTGKVLETPLDALKELDAGRWFGENYQGESIPTLDEVFEAVGKRIFINVELTNYATPKDQLPDKVAALVKRHSLEQQILFSSFNPLALRKVHSLIPDIPLGLLALPGRSGAWARSWFGNFFVPYQALHPELKDTTLQMIKKQHDNKCRVHTWTVNKPGDLEQLFRWGVDGVFTDDVPLAQKIRAEVQI